MENKKVNLDSVKANLKRNKLLIDFKMIPDEIKQQIEQELNEKIK
jgi:hypothetical protein